MNDKSENHTPEEPYWQYLPRLYESMSTARSLADACQSALKSVLEMAERPGGFLVLTSNDDGELLVIVSDGESAGWKKQIDDPDSELRTWAVHVMRPGVKHSEDKNNSDVSHPADLAASFPVLVEGNITGALLIQGDTLKTETRRDVEITLPLVGRMLSHVHNLGNIQQRAQELATLQTEITQLGFNADTELHQKHLLQGAIRLLDAEKGALIILDENNIEWMIRKTIGDGEEWSYQINPKTGKGLVRACLHTMEIVSGEDLANNPEFDPSSDAFGDLPLSTLICAPLIVNDQVHGAIQIINKRSGNSFNAFDRDLLSIIAGFTSNAMHGARLIQELKVTNADLEASRWELLGSRNTLRSLIDNLPTSLYIIDPEYKIMATNQGRASFTDMTPKSLVGKTCFRAFFDRSTPCPECRVKETFKEKVHTQRKENRQIGEVGTEWEINTYPISNDEGEVIQVILLEQDISEQQRLEGILAQSEKLAAIGQLAAGVAHEINNPLTAIIANAQILDRELPADSDLRDSVDLIARAGARATQVVRNLLDFARKESYHLGLTDVNETMQRSLDLMQHEILARSVELKYKPDQKLPTILASQDHLQSVWLNLVLNAIDSLDNQPGTIKVTTKCIGEEILVSVADNGKGISPQRLTRIFEPFYTTKEPGRGTGLGLSVCHRIVKQHGGHIRVESKVGAGSEFTVILPVT